jgi:hypothetical protein
MRPKKGTARRYFTLIARMPNEEHWEIQFGDFCRECVMDEARKLRASYRGLMVRIIETDDTQSAVNSVVNDMNFELRTFGAADRE